jgi:hypothetical protein
VSIHKKGDQADPNNYRPVSLTAVPCKIIEHIIHHSIMKHSDFHNILYKNQHGFRKKHSTETQLILTIEDLARSLDIGHDTDVMILDFSKAFDKVPHQRLLAKLHHYGIQGNTHTWIQNWLSDRTQQVVLNGKRSPPVSVTSGVPQGSVLGPLLFLLYINDIHHNTTSQVRLFADDCRGGQTLRRMPEHYRLTPGNPLTTMVEWPEGWQLHFNPSKCYHLQITWKHQPNKYQYSMYGQVLATVPAHKYLGVTVQGDLSWSDHITESCKKANKALSFIRRNLHMASQPIRKKACTTLVKPHVEYGSAVLDPHYKCYINEVEKSKEEQQDSSQAIIAGR